jgi:hypothetical protein
LIVKGSLSEVAVDSVAGAVQWAAVRVVVAIESIRGAIEWTSVRIIMTR